MAIARWDPWRELAALERRLDEQFSRFGRSSAGGGQGQSWAPAVDVHQEGDTMVVRAEVAGIEPEKVEITVDGDVLTIAGSREEDRSVQEGQWIRRERHTGTFQRAISLPPGVDADQIQANAENGVIEIRIPRPRAVEPHRVSVQSGGGSQNVTVGSGSDNIPASQSTASQSSGSQDGGSQNGGGATATAETGETATDGGVESSSS